MNAEKKKDWIRTSLLFFAVFAMLVTGLFLASVIRDKEHKDYSLTLSRFSSDFAEKEEILKYAGLFRMTKPQNPDDLYCSNYAQCVSPDDISCCDFIDRDG